MKIFKESKKQPIKFRNFTFIGYHPDYPAAYYYKDLGRDNFEIMECTLEGNSKKPEIGAGTNVKVIDSFMSNYIYIRRNNIKLETNKDFIDYVIKNTFGDYTDKLAENMSEKFYSKVPTEVKNSKNYKELLSDGYNLLYCSNDESEDRKMGIVTLCLVKEEHLKSVSKNIELDRKFTIFQPLQFRVSPGYIKGTSKVKYIEENHQPIVICHDLLK